MGSSTDVFIKYPRTPHLFGSRGAADDKHLSEEDSLRLIADSSLIVEEKLDGTNVGLHFHSDGEMILQCRGHLIAEGMHRQYDLFKHWAKIKCRTWEEHLEDRFILFGEWLFARHSVHYLQLDHYFYEFDIYDKFTNAFLDLEQRLVLIEKLGVHTVPVVYVGPADKEQLQGLIGPSQFDGRFENPWTGQTDRLMEGLYLRTEADGVVTGRAKFVRPEFVEKVKRSTHWQYQPMVPNLLKPGTDIWL